MGRRFLNLLRNRHLFVALLTLVLLVGTREVRLYDPVFVASLRALTFDT